MKKKSLIMIMLALVCIGVLSGTIAYFTTTSTFNNEFASKPYSTKVTEYFISPDNWTPGTTTDKTVNVENTGEVPVAVRVKFEEKWTDSNGKELPLEIEVDGEPERIVILNFKNDYVNKWTLINGWYYYNDNLRSGEITSDLLESVTFNPHVVASANCVTVNNEVTCTSTGEGYDNATYVLTITIETVQADVKKEYWNMPDTLYETLKEQAYPDNEASEFVKSDSGINFAKNSSNENGKGLYMIADTSSEKYPIYYYRGAVDNNNVLFAELCWKIVRTTETGGVKLIYNGIPTEQGNRKICDNTGETAQVAKSKFNNSSNSPAYVGYRYGTVYPYYSKSTISTDILHHTDVTLTFVNYYFSSTVSYENGKYTLGDDAAQYSWKDSWRDLIGYYTCYSETKTTCTSPYYMVGVTSSDGYFLMLLKGKMLDETNTNVVLGQSIQDNGNDTYTLKDTVTIKKTDWYNNYSKYKSYYACRNDLASDTCGKTDMNYIARTYTTGFDGFRVEKIKYGSSFTYDATSNTYTLKDTVEAIDPSSISSDLATHHYTCLNNTGICTSINYVYYLSGTTLYYISISDGKGVEKVLKEMLSSEAKTDSIIKDYLENDWYANNMKKYESYLEDTVWCNDQIYEDSKVNSGWNSSGGPVNKYLYFDNYYRLNSGTPSLKCREQDSLTVANKGVNKPVGLITSDEVIYAGGTSNTNKDYYLYTGAYYWTLSPYNFGYNYVYVSCVGSSGSLSSNTVTASYGVRPAVSLIPGAMYNDGDGTKENPYVITD